MLTNNFHKNGYDVACIKIYTSLLSSLTIIYREDLLVDWIAAITDYKIDHQYIHLEELLLRTLNQLPPSLREMIRRTRKMSTQGERARWVIFFTSSFGLIYMAPKTSDLFCVFWTQSATKCPLPDLHFNFLLLSHAQI